MLRFVCMGGMPICIPACLYSHALQGQKSHRNKTKYKISMLFLDQNYIFFPMVHFFCCTSNIMYRRMDKTIHRNSACIQPAFSANMTKLTGKQSASFERPLIFVSKQHYNFAFTFHVYMIYAFEGYGNSYVPHIHIRKPQHI
jgi:hypothetical protein